MLCYDTNVFINRGLIDVKIRQKIFLQLEEKKECIILRSIEKELLHEHFPNLSTALAILDNQRNKGSFDDLFNSKLFEQFKQKYRPIAEYILLNYKKERDIFSSLISIITSFSFLMRSSKCFFPMTLSEYEELENNPPKEYSEMCNRVKNKDRIHLGLLEWYGTQISMNGKKSIKISFISCDRRHITKQTAIREIKDKYKFIEPVDCEDYFNS